MGIFKVSMEVGDPQGRNFQEVGLLVDTGSTYTALPAELLRSLNVPVQESAQAEMANGTVEAVDVGETRVRLQGKSFTTPVIFAAEGGTQPAGSGVAGAGPSRRGSGTGAPRRGKPPADVNTRTQAHTGEGHDSL